MLWRMRFVCPANAPVREVQGVFPITLPRSSLVRSSSTLLQLVKQRLEQLNFFESTVSPEAFIETHRLNISFWRVYREIIVAFDCDIHAHTFRSKELVAYAAHRDQRKVLMLAFIPLGVPALYFGAREIISAMKKRQTGNILTAKPKSSSSVAKNDLCVVVRQMFGYVSPDNWVLKEDTTTHARQLLLTVDDDHSPRLLRFIFQVAKYLNVANLKLIVAPSFDWPPLDGFVKTQEDGNTVMSLWLKNGDEKTALFDRIIRWPENCPK